MPSSFGRVVSIVGSLLLFILAAGLGSTYVQPARAQSPAFTPSDEAPENFPNAPGREETFYACSACHGFRLVASQSMSRERWDETLEIMVQRQNMSPLDAKDRKLVLDYLTRVFPPKAPKYQNPFLKN
jgi:mono/diheme cytochrome c family protein